MIELAGGLLISNKAFILAIDLEFKGHGLTVKDGQLYISQASQLNVQDRAQIKQHRRHLMALAGYEVPT